MLNLNCVICAELFTQSDEVFITICGHMFHHTCLMQWLERSKTCPQCRNKCTTAKIWRVYFNMANLDVSRIDVGSLQEQLDNANLALKMKENETSKHEQQFKDLKDTQKKCLKTIAGLEQKLHKKDFLLSSFVAQINVLKSDVQAINELRSENKTLKHKIHTMESISAILTANTAEAEQLVRTEPNKIVLANWVITLKRELRQCESKRSEVRNVLKVVQNDLRKELDIKRKLEEQLSHLESDLYQAQEKLKSSQSQPIDLDSLPIQSLGLNNNLNALKREEKRSTISPITKQNIKRIEESTSPYLNIKSSSVGLAHLLKAPKKSPAKGPMATNMTTGVVRKTKSDLSDKYSILKKPRLLLSGTTSSLASTMNPSFAFNGMGGSEKIDPFAERDDVESTTIQAVTSHSSLAKSVNTRLKAGTLRNIKLTK